MLLERRGIDVDLAECLILRSLLYHGEKCETYFASTLKAFCNEFIYLNGPQFGLSLEGDQKQEVLKEAELAYLKGIRESSDPRLYAMYANFVVLLENSTWKESPKQEILKAYEKSFTALDLALESFRELNANKSKHRLPQYMDEWNESFLTFELHHVYAKVLHNKISLLYQKLADSAKGSKKAATVKNYCSLIVEMQNNKKKHLELFLDQAPIDHWDVPSASLMLSLEWISRKSPPVGADPKELYQRNKPDVERSIKMYKKAMESQSILNQWMLNEHGGSSSLTETQLFKEAAKLQEMLKSYGYVEDIPEPIRCKSNDNHSVSESVHGSIVDKVQHIFSEENHINVQFLYLFIFTALLAEPILSYFGFVSSE